jgi:Zn-dependent protease/CBS domain-containing protein
MRWSWRIGKLSGINVYVHATFVLLMLFILLAYWFNTHNFGLAARGAFFVLVVFACIVAHEFGHALTARRYGIQTRDIILLPIGGISRLERMPEDPRQELAVALAGPAVNMVIAAAVYLLLVATGHAGQLRAMRAVHWTSGPFLVRVIAVNLMLVAFNVLPAFPMDGGRVLRALLARHTDYVHATQVAAHIGQAMAFIFAIVGLFYDPFLVFIALFVWMGASEEAGSVLARTSLSAVPVQRVMRTDFHTLGADDPLSKAVDYTLAGGQQDFPVLFGDHVLGMLTRERLMRTLSEQGPNVSVRAALERDVATVDSHDMLDKAIERLQRCNCRSIPVEHNGQLVGVLTMENVAEFIMIQSALRRARTAKQAREVAQGSHP